MVAVFPALLSPIKIFSGKVSTDVEDLYQPLARGRLPAVPRVSQANVHSSGHEQSFVGTALPMQEAGLGQRDTRPPSGTWPHLLAALVHGHTPQCQRTRQTSSTQAPPTNPGQGDCRAARFPHMTTHVPTMWCLPPTEGPPGRESCRTA